MLSWGWVRGPVAPVRRGRPDYERGERPTISTDIFNSSYERALDTSASIFL
jgi:hypothetical protein